MKISSSCKTSTQTAQMLLRFRNPEGVLAITDLSVSPLTHVFPCRVVVTSVHPGSVILCFQHQTSHFMSGIFPLPWHPPASLPQLSSFLYPLHLFLFLSLFSGVENFPFF